MPPEHSRGASPYADAPGKRAGWRAPVSIDEGGRREAVIARRNALAVAHMYLVPPIARRLARRLPAVYDVQDLESAGYAALLAIALRYRPEAHGGTPFSAFARKRLIGAMLDAVRLRHVTQTHWAEMLPLEEGRELRTEPDVEVNIDARRLAARVAAAIERLTPLRAAICDRYYSPEMPSLEAVARSLGLPVSRVAKERAAAIADLKRWLGA